MTRIKRPFAATGAAVLLALSLTACGGGAPADASEEDFCEVINDTSFADDIEPDDYDAQADALQDYADQLEEVGTPESISDDAREGFEMAVDEIGNISAGDLEDAAESGEEAENPFGLEFSDEEQDKFTAFNEYASETCSE